MRRAFVLVLLAFACHTKRPLELPPAPPDTKSMLVAIDPPTGEIRVTAFNWPDQRPTAFAAARESKVTILFYEDTLTALGLDSGPVANALGKAVVAPLPEPDDGFESQRDDSGFIASWSPVDGVEGDLRDFRIEGDSPERCAMGGGCYPDQQTLDANACITPCPVTPVIPAMPPEPAKPPMFECPPTWVTVAVDDVEACEPAPRDCMGHQLIDQTTCEGVSSACATDGWPAMVPTDRTVIYVDAAVGAGGSGVRTDPYGTVDAAIDAAPAVAAIALRRGTYTMSPRDVAGELEIIGGCALETTFMGTLNVINAASSVTLRDVTVRGSDPLANVAAGAALVVRDVVVNTTGTADSVTTDGGSIALTRTVFDDVGGSAVAMTNGSLTAEHVVVDGGGDVAFDLGNRTMATLTDVVVEHGADAAIVAESGTVVSVERALLLDNRRNAIQLNGANGTFDYIVVKQNKAFDRRDGRAIHAVDAVAVVDHAYINDTETSGIRLDASELTLTDAVVRDSKPRPEDDEFGMSIAVLGGSTATLWRVDLGDAHRWGINAFDASRVLGGDVSIRDIENGIEDRLATGLEVSDASVVSLDGVRILNVVTIGVGIDLENPMDCKTDLRTMPIRIDNLTIESTRIGVRMNCKAEMTFRKTAMRAIGTWGVDINASAIGHFDDLRIEDVGTRAVDTFDDGLFDGTRVELVDAPVGISSDFRGVVEADNLLIDCGPNGFRRGIAIRYKNFGKYDLSSFEIRNCDNAFWLSYAPPTKVNGGYVHDNGIAVETVETPDFDIRTFMLNTRYENNDRLLGEYNAQRD